MEHRTLDVARDFSPFPFGRYRKDGPKSGEAFREDLLWPILEKGDRVSVVLDNVRGGLGSSFLEEVFGGLIREHGLTVEFLKERIKIISDEDPALAESSWIYVERARG
jgi:hypothetical protein